MATVEGGPPMGMTECVGDAQAEADRWNSKGNAYLAVRDYFTAISCFDLALKTHPGSRQEDIFLSNRATALFRIGDYEAAIEGFRRASQLRPDKHSHLTCLGKVYLRWGCHEAEALEALTASLRLQPTDVAASLVTKAQSALDKSQDRSASPASAASAAGLNSLEEMPGDSPCRSARDSATSPMSFAVVRGLIRRDSIEMERTASGGVVGSTAKGSRASDDTLRGIMEQEAHFDGDDEDEGEEATGATKATGASAAPEDASDGQLRSESSPPKLMTRKQTAAQLPEFRRADTCGRTPTDSSNAAKQSGDAETWGLDHFLARLSVFGGNGRASSGDACSDHDGKAASSCGGSVTHGRMPSQTDSLMVTKVESGKRELRRRAPREAVSKRGTPRRAGPERGASTEGMSSDDDERRVEGGHASVECLPLALQAVADEIQRATSRQDGGWGPASQVAQAAIAREAAPVKWASERAEERVRRRPTKPEAVAMTPASALTVTTEAMSSIAGDDAESGTDTPPNLSGLRKWRAHRSGGSAAASCSDDARRSDPGAFVHVYRAPGSTRPAADGAPEAQASSSSSESHASGGVRSDTFWPSSRGSAAEAASRGFRTRLASTPRASASARRRIAEGLTDGGKHSSFGFVAGGNLALARSGVPAIEMSISMGNDDDFEDHDEHNEEALHDQQRQQQQEQQEQQRHVRVRNRQRSSEVALPAHVYESNSSAWHEAATDTASMRRAPSSASEGEVSPRASSRVSRWNMRQRSRGHSAGDGSGEWEQAAPSGRWRLWWPGRSRHVTIGPYLESPAAAAAKAVSDSGFFARSSPCPTNMSVDGRGRSFASNVVRSRSVCSSPVRVSQASEMRRGRHQGYGERSHMVRASTGRSSGGSSRRLRPWVRLSGKDKAVPREETVSEWVLAVLGSRALGLVDNPNASLADSLQDGRVLVRLAHAVGVGVTTGMAQDMEAATPMLQLVNVHTFFALARAIGVPKSSLFHPRDLVDVSPSGRCAPNVLRCLAALSDAARGRAYTIAGESCYSGPFLALSTSANDRVAARFRRAPPLPDRKKREIRRRHGNMEGHVGAGRQAVGEETPTSPDSGVSMVSSSRART